jgi:hypothetical protein
LSGTPVTSNLVWQNLFASESVALLSSEPMELAILARALRSDGRARRAARGRVAERRNGSVHRAAPAERPRLGAIQYSSALENK